MPQMQDKYSKLSPQYKQLPEKSTISAIAMWRSISIAGSHSSQSSLSQSKPGYKRIFLPDYDSD